MLRSGRGREYRRRQGGRVVGRQRVPLGPELNRQPRISAYSTFALGSSPVNSTRIGEMAWRVKFRQPEIDVAGSSATPRIGYGIRGTAIPEEHTSAVCVTNARGCRGFRLISSSGTRSWRSSRSYRKSGREPKPLWTMGMRGDSPCPPSVLDHNFNIRLMQAKAVCLIVFGLRGRWLC
jgi:hypothetical protein